VHRLRSEHYMAQIDDNNKEQQQAADWVCGRWRCFMQD
jgi:hypothetical protein